MRPIDRRAFLAASAAAVGVAAGHAATATARADDPPATGWRKAFMLGGLSSGPVGPTFAMLREAGFEGVELLAPNGLDLDEVLKAKEATGLAIHGISGSKHWTEPLSSPDKAVVERGMAAIRRSIADCKAYGGSTVLLVPAVVTTQVSHRQAWERSQAAIRALIPEAEAAGVAIAIEEVWNRFLLTAPEMSRYIDDFKSPTVRAYFDVGNVVEYGYPQEWIRELGPRIAKIHVKEYGKPKRFNYPLGDGEIDWAAVRSALESIGYRGWITAEVGLGDLAEMKDVIRRMTAIFG